MAEPQYNMFYGKEDLLVDENGQVIRTEDYSNLDQDQVDEPEMDLDHEDQAYFAQPYPRRARSDGEILALYQFPLHDDEYDEEVEEEEDESVGQISLHNDGEEDYGALVDKNKKFMFDKQEKYFEVSNLF